jgi:hypothetical protein
MGRVTSIARAIACVALGGIVNGCSEDPSSLDTRQPSTTGTSGGTTADTSDPSSPAAICVATINQLRAMKGLAPYARWSATETCADGEATHDGSGAAAHGAFGMCGEIAQNECPGWPGPPATMIPQCLKAMWGEGPGGGHYEAMTSRLYTKVSCGFGTAPDGSIWAVQNFH